MPGGPGAGGRSIFNIGKVFPQGAKDVKSKVVVTVVDGVCFVRKKRSELRFFSGDGECLFGIW